jgi:hypothetical protein
MNPTTQTTSEDTKAKEQVDEASPAETDGEEFQITVKKLELPVKPRGVLAE